MKSNKPKWNPNYMAYAASQNLSPEECMTKDAEKYPGGKMAGFMIWMSEQICEFDKIHRPADTYSTPGFYSPNQKHYIRNQKALSEWIQNKVSFFKKS